MNETASATNEPMQHRVHIIWSSNSALHKKLQNTHTCFPDASSSQAPSSGLLGLDDSSKTASKENRQVDADNALPSLGSSQHAEGLCKPCVFVAKTLPCEKDKECKFCHFAHGPDTPVRPKKHNRGKNERQRYRMFMQSVGSIINREAEG